MTFLLIGGLGAFSDKLLVVQFLAPLCAGVAPLGRAKWSAFGKRVCNSPFWECRFCSRWRFREPFNGLDFIFSEVETSSARLHFPDLFRMSAGYSRASRTTVLCRTDSAAPAGCHAHHRVKVFA